MLRLGRHRADASPRRDALVRHLSARDGCWKNLVFRLPAERLDSVAHAILDAEAQDIIGDASSARRHEYIRR